MALQGIKKPSLYDDILDYFCNIKTTPNRAIRHKLYIITTTIKTTTYKLQQIHLFNSTLAAR